MTYHPGDFSLDAGDDFDPHAAIPKEEPAEEPSNLLVNPDFTMHKHVEFSVKEASPELVELLYGKTNMPKILNANQAASLLGYTGNQAVYYMGTSGKVTTKSAMSGYPMWGHYVDEATSVKKKTVNDFDYYLIRQLIKATSFPLQYGAGHSYQHSGDIDQLLFLLDQLKHVQETPHEAVMRMKDEWKKVTDGIASGLGTMPLTCLEPKCWGPSGHAGTHVLKMGVDTFIPLPEPLGLFSCSGTVEAITSVKKPDVMSPKTGMLSLGFVTSTTETLECTLPKWHAGSHVTKISGKFPKSYEAPNLYESHPVGAVALALGQIVMG